jgi:pyrimidine deaminase RibD-like protein
VPIQEAGEGKVEPVPVDGEGREPEQPAGRLGVLRMTDDELMKLAIVEAQKCSWSAEDEKRKPKVGAVISVDGEPIATAHRAQDEHAEKLALSMVSGRDLNEATVWTTLEPCTRAVRRTEGESCTERLISAGVRKVVIGILDPNQGVCGKGLLELQNHQIEVRLFPHELALRIRRLNEEFIRIQQTLGIEITSPREGDVIPMGYAKIKGTFINPPGPDVYAMTYVEPVAVLGFDGGWWPQGPVRIVPDEDKQWEVTVNFGIALPHTICIVRASDLGLEFLRFYDSLKAVRNHIIHNVANLYRQSYEHVRLAIAPSYWPLPMRSLPKGLDIQASVKVAVSKLVSGEA